MEEFKNQFEREMGLTHKEFYRALPIALASYRYKTEDHNVIVDFSPGSLHLQLSAEGQRRIASLTIPNIVVSFKFIGVTQAHKRQFMAQFSRAFQRGGG